MPNKPHYDYDNEIKCYTTSDTIKKKSKLGYYLFCIKWLWKNREWENTRQKFKAMEKAYKEQPLRRRG